MNPQDTKQLEDKDMRGVPLRKPPDVFDIVHSYMNMGMTKIQAIEEVERRQRGQIPEHIKDMI